MTLSAFSCAYWPSICSLWRSICLDLPSIFSLGCFVFCYCWAVYLGKKNSLFKAWSISVGWLLFFFLNRKSHLSHILNRKCDSLRKLHLCSHEFSSTHKSIKLMSSSNAHFASFYINQRSQFIQCFPHVIMHSENVKELGPSMLYLTLWKKCPNWRSLTYMTIIKLWGSGVKLFWMMVQTAGNGSNNLLLLGLFCGKIIETSLTFITFHKICIELHKCLLWLTSQPWWGEG